MTTPNDDYHSQSLRNLCAIAHSNWINLRFFLIFRLFCTAFLVAHLVFFAFRSNFSFILYHSFVFLFTCITLCILVSSSLIALISDQHTNIQTFPAVQPQNPPADLLSSQSHLVPSSVRRFHFIAALFRQVAFTAALFLTIVHWPFLQSHSFRYPVAVQTLSPIIILSIDLCLSTFFYPTVFGIFTFVIFNIVYGTVYVIRIYRFSDDPPYSYLNQYDHSQRVLIIRWLLLAISSFLLASLVYACPRLVLWIVRLRRRTLSPTDPKQPHCQNSLPNSSEPTSITSLSIQTSSPNSNQPKIHISDSHQIDNTSHSTFLLSDVLRSDDDHQASCQYDGYNTSECSAKDRRSLPLCQSIPRRLNEDAVVLRPTAGRSKSLLENERSNVSASLWKELDTPSVKMENAFFKMPAVLEAQGLHRDVVPLPRIESSRSGKSVSSGILSRASSGKSLRKSISGRKPPSTGLSAKDTSGPSTTKDSGPALVQSMQGKLDLKNDSGKERDGIR